MCQNVDQVWDDRIIRSGWIFRKLPGGGHFRHLKIHRFGRWGLPCWMRGGWIGKPESANWSAKGERRLQHHWSVYLIIYSYDDDSSSVLVTLDWQWLVYNDFWMQYHFLAPTPVSQWVSGSVSQLLIVSDWRLLSHLRACFVSVTAAGSLSHHTDSQSSSHLQGHHLL